MNFFLLSSSWQTTYRASGVKLFLCGHGKGRTDLSAERSMRMSVRLRRPSPWPGAEAVTEPAADRAADRRPATGRRRSLPGRASDPARAREPIVHFSVLLCFFSKYSRHTLLSFALHFPILCDPRTTLQAPVAGHYAGPLMPSSLSQISSYLWSTDGTPSRTNVSLRANGVMALAC